MTNRVWSFPLLLVLAILLSAALHAQTSPANPATAPSTTPPTSSATDVVSTGTQSAIVEYAPPPAEYARAKAYSTSHYRHFFVNTLYGLLVLLVVLRWRAAPAFRNLAERVSARRGVQLIVFAPLILLTIAVL